MIRKTAPAAAALLLATASLAVAQSDRPDTQAPPAKTPSGESITKPGGGTMWYSHVATELRASKLIGSSVVNAANETVGNINEIVLSNDGKVAAVVIGVGGFLGIGEREVAVSFESVRVQRDQNDNLKLVANVTKDQLKAAPEWRWEPKSKQ